MATDPRVQYPAGSGARGDRFDAFGRHALQGQADRRAARLHRRRSRPSASCRSICSKPSPRRRRRRSRTRGCSPKRCEAEALEKQVQHGRGRAAADDPADAADSCRASISPASTSPASTLGGDFYDFIPLPDDNVGLVIADVSGKGVPASLIMASVRAALAGAGRQRLLPLRGDAAGQPDALPRHQAAASSSRCSTACSTRATAGSPTATPAIRRACCCATARSSSWPATTWCSASTPTSNTSSRSSTCKADDLLLLYTDGVHDAMNFEQRDASAAAHARTPS